MGRFTCSIAAVVALLVVATPAVLASVPDAGNSTITWMDLQGDDLYLCPACDGSYLDVTVKDQFNVPMGGVLVQVVFSNTIELVLWEPVEGYTDVNGNVVLRPCASLDLHPDSLLAPTTQVTVTCLGVTLAGSTGGQILTPGHENLDGIAQAPSRYMLSPDYNADGIVEGLDFSYFSADWLSLIPQSRSNFNRYCDEAGGECVGGLDYALFALYWLSAYTP